MSGKPGVPQATHRPPRDHTDRWRTAAGCARTDDPGLFFPDNPGAAAQAREVCAQCPVTQECLAHALTHHEAGIWGGTSEYERRQLRRGHTLRTRPAPRHRPAGATALADRLGISRHQIADYETGRYTPVPEVRARIDKAIG